MNNILKTVGKLALPILLVAMFSPISVPAQDTGGECKTGRFGVRSTTRRRQRKLEGWNHRRDEDRLCNRSVIGTFSLNVHFFAWRNILGGRNPNAAPSLRSPSHGVWSHDSGRLYTTAFQFFRFNANGTLAGRLIVRQEIEVSEDGESYTATSTSQFSMSTAT